MVRLDSFINNNCLYLYLFDEIIRKEKTNKDAFLKSLDINPSSYRRAKQANQKISLQIIEKLSSFYQMPLLSSLEITNEELFLNNLIYGMVYKLNYRYEEISKIIDDKIKLNNVFAPIYKLFKILILIYASKDLNKLNSEYLDLFNEVKRYKLFYGQDLEEIYELVTIAFSTDINSTIMNLKYQNSLSNITIAEKFRVKNKYYESLYYANKAKVLFMVSNNYRRVMFTNFIILDDLFLIYDYEACYKLAYEQVLTLGSFNETGPEIKTSFDHLVVSLLALGKYFDVIRLLQRKEQCSSLDFCYLLVALYKQDSTNFETNFLDFLKEKKLKFSNNELLDNLKKYLNSKDKKTLAYLKCQEELNRLIIILERA